MNDLEPLDLATLEKESVEVHLNSEFQLEVPGNDELAVLKLTEVSHYPDHRPPESRSGRPPFSAVFICKTHQMPQGTYCLKHEVLAPLVVFLSPFESGEEGLKLEAVFS